MQTQAEIEINLRAAQQRLCELELEYAAVKAATELLKKQWTVARDREWRAYLDAQKLVN